MSPPGVPPFMVWFQLLLYVVLPLANVHGRVYVSEFLASNDNGLQDSEGDFEDWIELHNDGTDPVDLTDHFLSDDVDETDLWQFPDGTMIPSNEYLIVFASDKADIVGELHASFKLRANGEDLVFSDTSDVLSSFVDYPPQETDRSYGVDANGDEGFFTVPTPGESNNLIDPPVVEASEPRGFKTSTFDVTLTPTAVSGIIVRYTTDGSQPTLTNGMDFVMGTPVTVTTTTTLRARSIRAATGDASRTATFSYIFISDVVQQPREIDNFPNGRSRVVCGLCTIFDLSIIFRLNERDLDMEMDPHVVEEYGERLTNGLLSIPTLSLVGDVEDIFGEDGFYFSFQNEREMSLEVLYDDASGEESEQIDVGVESQSRDRLKRSMRLNFRSEYGNRNWYTELFQNSSPLNGDSAVDEFRTVILRSGNQNAWNRQEGASRATIIMDQFVRDTHLSVSGTPNAHGTYVHVYLNGVYWGMYNMVERADQHFANDYSDFDGDEDNWFFSINTVCDNCTEAPRAQFLLNDLVNRDLSIAANYAEMQEYVDVDRFRDYMIVQLWAGVSDWPKKNFYVNYYMGDDENPPTPIKFIAWDAEYAFNNGRKIEDIGAGEGAFVSDEVRYNNIAGGSLSRIWHAMFTSPVFRTSFVERVDELLGDGQLLSAAVSIQRWNALAAFVEGAIIGESARWGDSLDLGLFEPDGQWTEQLEVVRELIRSNKGRFLDELTKAGLYGPDLRATEECDTSCNCPFDFIPLLGNPLCAALDGLGILNVQARTEADNFISFALFTIGENLFGQS